MKVLYDSNNFIRGIVTNETPLLNNSFNVIVVADYSENDIFDYNMLPRYKVVNDAIELITDATEYQVDSSLWQMYLDIVAMRLSDTDFMANVPLDAIKEIKIEELRTACNAEILLGFYSTIKYNTSKHYSYTYEDQLNISAIMQNILLDELSLLYGYVVYYKSSDMTNTEVWSHNDFKQLFIDSENFKKSKTDIFYTKRQSVVSATTKEDVLNITWN